MVRSTLTSKGQITLPRRSATDSEAADVLEFIVEGDGSIRVRPPERVRSVEGVLRAYQESPADLSDLLLALRGRELGATTTYTFDRALRGMDGFTVLR